MHEITLFFYSFCLFFFNCETCKHLDRKSTEPTVNNVVAEIAANKISASDNKPAATSVSNVLDHVNEEEASRMSVLTLSALLGSIYGLAFIMAIVWVVWIWVKRRSTTTPYKTAARITSSRSRDVTSISSAS